MLSSNLTIDDVIIDHDVLFESIRKSFTRDPFDHYVNGICGLCICLIGIISNLLSFSILIRRTMDLSTYVYLAALCLSDFTTCLFLIPGYILDAYPLTIPDSELPLTYAYTRFLIIAGAISTTGRALSVWLCVAFTIDRWIMICRPFVGPIYCTMKNARYVTLIIYIIGVFYAVPLMFEYEPHVESWLTEILLANHHKNSYRRKLSSLGQNSIFRWTYVLINCLAVYIIPLTIIIILNRKLILSIRLIKRRSAQYNAPLPTKQGITIMLLATTLMLLVFRSLSAIISIMWLIRAKMFINEKAPFRLRKFHTIANLCATLNAATTFIMFIMYGKKFRLEFTRIYCCCFKTLKQQKKITIINKEEQQQINQFIPKDNKQHDNNNNNNKRNSSPIPEIRQKITRNSSATTTSTSIASFQSLKRLRNYRRKTGYSLDQQFDLINHDKNTNDHYPQQLQQQYELTIREDECNTQDNDRNLVTLSTSYSDWLKNLIHCQ